MKKIVYIDMDGVLVDFQTGIDQLPEHTKIEFEGRLDEVQGIFGLMQPKKGALEAVETLAQHFELYVLSTAPWNNPSAWIDKIKWIHEHFGNKPHSVFYKRLILSHHKNLNRGHYLIDDREHNGAKDFEGEHILFASAKFPDWKVVTSYLIESK
jgi:5'-nucleotidase